MEKPAVSKEEAILHYINNYSDIEFNVFCEQIMQSSIFCSHINLCRPFNSMRKMIQAMTLCLDTLSFQNKVAFIILYNSFLDEFFTNVRDMQVMNIKYEEGNVEYVIIRQALNSYYKKFEFHFIINPSKRTLKELYNEIIRRLTLSREEEVEEVIQEIKSIITDRLLSLKLVR